MKTDIFLKMATMTTLPLTVTLVSSADRDNKPNIAVVTYVTGVNEDPAMFGIALRPGKYTNELIKKSKEFVINIPTSKLIKEIDYCGTHSGRNVQKFNKLNLTPLKAEKVRTPLVGECPINIECKVTQVISLPSHDFFIGLVVAVHIDKKLAGKEKNRYGITLPEFKNLLFVFTTFLDYRMLGRKIGTAFQEHKKLNLEKTAHRERKKICL